jgi:four helix bundle protein
LKQQLRRAGDSAILNRCEGAGRFKLLEKAHLYDIARGSVTECAGGLDAVEWRDILPATRVAGARELARRAACMLTRLSTNWRSRAG